MKFLLYISVIVSPFFFAHTVQAEEITQFSAVYTIVPDATVRVVEEITYDFKDGQKHGIYRNLKTGHPQPASSWYKNRFVDIDIESVEKNGNSEPFEVSSFGDSTDVKIGDADVYVTGVQEYRIVYTMRGALSYGTDGAELYWNATGNEWEVPIQTVSIVVLGPSVLPTATCYQGVEGSTERCTVTVGTSSNVFESSVLEPGEGLTIATEIDSNGMPVILEERLADVYSIAAQAVVFFGLLYGLFRWHSHYKIAKPIIAQYEPYENYLPMYTGVLFDRMLDAHDITAGILYLAEQGFISITKTERKVLLVFSTTDYDITLLRPLAELTSSFLMTLSGLLFASEAPVGTTVAISTLSKKSAENKAIIVQLQKDIAADIKANGFIERTYPFLNRNYLVAGIALGLVLIIWSFFLFIACAIIVFLFFVISRRTERGYEALNHIEGFKLFLSVTDKERFEFHNAPEKSPELFMQYLPYAVALKVEEKWAKVFEGITIANPSWYHDGAGGSFTAAALVSDIGSFSSSFSSSSGTSGSSGGGSSGGGGGGGGGGSW